MYIFETADDTPEFSVNDYLQSMYLLIDACKRASAENITLVIPNYFYARQDKKDNPHVPISAKVVASILEKVFNVTRVITVDLHAAQIQGFFDIPVDNIFAIRDLVTHVKMLMSVHEPARYVLISPDVGGEKRIESWHKKLGIPYIVCAKHRDHTKSSVVDKVFITGDTTYLEGSIGIVVDDIMDTCGTVKALIDALESCKFAEIWLVCTHGIFSGSAADKLNSVPLIKHIICTNTIDQRSKGSKITNLDVVDLSTTLAETICRVLMRESVSDMFA